MFPGSSLTPIADPRAHAVLAEDVAQQHGAAVEHLGLMVEAGGALNEAEDLDDAFDLRFRSPR